MSYFTEIKIKDKQGDVASVTQAGALFVTDGIRASGSTMTGTQLDPNFWTSAVTGTGTVTQANSVQTLETGVTANSTAEAIATDVCRFVGQEENRHVSQVRLSTTGVSNTAFYWGFADKTTPTNGAYFKLDGTTMYVVTLKGGVETAVDSASWNGSTTVPTLTNYNSYAIEYRTRSLVFIINGTAVHTASFTAGPWTNQLNLYAYSGVINTGGSTTDALMYLMTSTIDRFGPLETQSKYFHGTGAATNVLKYSAGTLHRVIVNTTVGTGSSTVTIYDNTAGSGTTIAVLTFPNNSPPVCLEYHVPFKTGLTIVTTGATWDFTVVYQ